MNSDELRQRFKEDQEAARNNEGEGVGGIHVDYLLFTGWRDRISAGLCKCRQSDHGADDECDRVDLAMEIIDNLQPRWPWGITTSLMCVVQCLDAGTYWDDEPPSVCPGDSKAVEILQEMADIESGAYLNRRKEP
jgi:hypothetical protein